MSSTINGKFVRAKVEPGDDGWAMAVSAMWARDCAISAGTTVDVELAPEGPQRSGLAPDVAVALDANPKAAAYFDTLAQFYTKAYLRWIDATLRCVQTARLAVCVRLRFRVTCHSCSAMVRVGSWRVVGR